MPDIDPTQVLDVMLAQALPHVSYSTGHGPLAKHIRVLVPFAKLWLKHEWSQDHENYDVGLCPECGNFESLPFGNSAYAKEVGHRLDCALNLAFKEAGLR